MDPIKQTFLYAIALLLFVLSHALQGQNHMLSGTVSSSGRGVPDAVVHLLTADSSMVKAEITDDKGSFAFSATPAGSYRLLITSMGMHPKTTGVIRLRGDTTVGAIGIDVAAKDLKEVTVTAKKPFVTREQGKVVVRPGESVTLAGSSVFDVIEKSPGVRVDANENISLNGRPGVVIWIDGKPAPMSGQQLADFLRGMPTESIETIELITNPPASYDAAGSSVIHIRTKRDKRMGTNGSISLSYGQGVYPKSNNSVSFNHREKKFNVFASYSYARRMLFSHLSLKREFSVRDTFTGAFDQNNHSKFDFDTHTGRIGLDYFASKKTTVGFLVGGGDNQIDMDRSNGSEVFDSDYQRVSVFRTTGDNHRRWSNITGNVNLRHELDSAGTALTVDLDAARYINTSDQDIQTRYYDLMNRELQAPYLLLGDLRGQFDLLAIKADYNRAFSNRLKIEAGIKSSVIVANNDLKFFDQSSGTAINDTTKTNHFVYNENINAAYASGSGQLDKWSYRLGLRVEQTRIDAVQRKGDQAFKRDYAQLFPNVLIGRELGKSHQLELLYSRRIRRPDYEQLNPFKFYLDPTTYAEGYPFLQPSTTESFELTHTFKNKIYTSVGFGRTFNNLIQVIAPLDKGERVTVQTTRNLAMVDVYTINGGLPFDITRWWSTTTDYNVYFAFYSGDVANTPLAAKGGLNGSLNTTHNFILPWGLALELGGWWQSRELYAFDVIRPMGGARMGIQKKLLNDRGMLRFNVTDIFYTARISANVSYTDYDEQFLVERDTRVATIAFSYKFGQNPQQGQRRRQGGADDIKQRVGEGAG